MEDAGFSELMDEARKAGGKSKTRIGRFLGEHIDSERVPEVFTNLLDEIIELAGA